MIHTKKGYTTPSGDISLSFLFVVRQTCGVSDHSTEAYEPQDANARASEAIANVLDFSKKETPSPDPDGREKKIQLIRTSHGQKASSGQ